jgi:tRNA threonylcarbamoyladenosine biosynthesis protein TsaE
MKTYQVKNISQLPLAAQELLNDFADERIFAFKAAMGAGKTTFIKAICEILNVEDVVNSPTFAIVNSYFSKQAGEVFHFDFYRLEKPTDAYDIGFEEYLSSGNYCFMEWAEKIENILYNPYVLVEIEEQTDNSRIITAKVNFI